jgi:hypothetical protein
VSTLKYPFVAEATREKGLDEINEAVQGIGKTLESWPHDGSLYVLTKNRDEMTRNVANDVMNVNEALMAQMTSAGQVAYPGEPATDPEESA